MLISFVVLILTSVILYIVPQGRIAYWADWHLWGLTKAEWGNLHINIGFLFLLAGLLHLYYNWRPITAYMKNRARELKVFTLPFNIAMLLTLIVAVGTYLEIPPMSSVINFGESIKDRAAEKYGEPPYGHAELSSLKLFAKKQGMDLEQVLVLLEKEGIEFKDSSDTLLVISSANGISPQDLYAVIKPAADSNESEGKAAFPDSPMPGFGSKTLGEICAEYNLLFPAIKRGLAGKGVKADADMTIKEIAAANKKDPMAIFEDIHGLVNEGR